MSHCRATQREGGKRKTTIASSFTLFTTRLNLQQEEERKAPNPSLNTVPTTIMPSFPIQTMCVHKFPELPPFLGGGVLVVFAAKSLTKEIFIAWRNAMSHSFSSFSHRAFVQNILNFFSLPCQLFCKNW
jgi:hypothetical protein